LPHSLARNRALIDGDRRLALAPVIAFCGLNGCRLTLTSDQACDLVMTVAAGGAGPTLLPLARPGHRARAGVAVIPGPASGASGHIRISFASEIAQL
jgi:prophage maintenance system killer protein